MRDVLVRSHDNHATPVSIDAPHVENVTAALQVRAEHLFVVTKPVTALLGRRKKGMASMASSRWPCWKTARTSITESISAPLGVYLLTGDRGDSARNSHRVRSPEEGPTGFCGDKGEETPAAVRFDCTTQVNRLGICHHRLWPLAARRAGVQRPRHFPPSAGELGGLINK